MGLLDPPALTKAAADVAYAAKSAVASRTPLPTFSYWAHRGGCGYAPEESADAYRISFAGGADVLDGDAQATSEGAYVNMHDSTVDRTTNGTGNVSDYTLPALLQLNAAATFSWPTTSPPAIITDLLSLYAARTYLSEEPKDPAQAVGLMDLFDAAGAAPALIINTRDTTVLTAAKARGYKVYFYWANGSGGTRSDGVGVGITIAAAKAAGADFFGCDYSAQSLSIADLVASGVPVVPYGVMRRVERDHLITVGAKGVLSDHCLYLKANTSMGTQDQWKRGVYGYGLQGSPKPSLSPSKYVAAVGLGLTFSDGNSIVPGGYCPLTNAATAYNIDCDYGYLDDPSGSGTPALGFAFGLPDDGHAALGGTTGLPFTGWEVYLRWAGGMTLYKYTSRTDTATVTSGSATVLDTTITTADAGRPVRGAGILPGTFVGPAANIVAGTSFALTSSSTSQVDAPAYANATSVSIGGIQAAVNSTAITTGQLVAGTLPHWKVIVTGSLVQVARTDAAMPTLSAALTSGVAVTALPVAALPVAVASGQKLLLANNQVATASSAATAGATSIPVTSITPTSTIASGTVVGLAVVTTDSTNRGGYMIFGWTAGLTTARKRMLNLTVS